MTSTKSSPINGSSHSPHPPLDTSASPLLDQDEPPILEHGPHFRQSPLEFLRKFSLHVSGADWRSYDNYIGRKIFYPGFNQEIKDAVNASPLLRSKISELARSHVRIEEESHGVEGKEAGRKEPEIVKQLNGLVDTMMDKMMCKMDSKAAVRHSFYFTTQMMTRTYHQGVHVSSEEILQLRAVAAEAAKKQQSIIFLPSHRSHIDYIALQVICIRLGLSIPTILAGDNLNFPVIGTFLQHVGAMFIRRSFGDDQLYITLVQTYIDVLLQKGLNLECFIEGSRSRIGKLLPPKLGFLGFLLDSVLSGRVDDAIICPVSTQYDKVIEVESYLQELLGRPKPKENLMGFLSASSVLNLKLGRIDVRFNKCFSLKSFIQDQVSKHSLTAGPNSAVQKSFNKDMRLRILRSLGYQVLSDINACSIVMPTALVGTILLTHRGRGLGKTELIRRVDWLTDRVRGQGGRVARFAGSNTATIVERALEVLGPKLIGVQQDVAEETYFPLDSFNLSFYRNMTIHLFISQAIVAAGMYSEFRDAFGQKEQRMDFRKLEKRVAFLSRLFRDEFIFPMIPLRENIQQTLTGLEQSDIITITRSGNTNSEEAIASVELSTTEREHHHENFDFYCYLVWPFVETYWLGAISLIMLVPPSTEGEANQATTLPWWLDSRVLLNHAQILGKTLHAQGDLTNFEAVNKETLKNAIARYEEDGIIIVQKPAKGSKAAPMMRLGDGWMPAIRDPKTGRLAREGRLWDFCVEVGMFRMDRTVGRVLRLVDLVGKQMWAFSADLEAAGPRNKMKTKEKHVKANL